MTERKETLNTENINNHPEQQVGKKKRSLAGKILRVTFKVILGIILLVTLIVFLITTSPVQQFIKNKATIWLSNKLDTKIEIGKIYIGFPKKIVLEKIYVEDKTKDTLLYGGAIKVDVSMLKLLRNELEISEVQLSDITANVKRLLPDTIYNFQFIIDAFASADTVQTTSSDSSSMKISVKEITLDNIRIAYDDDASALYAKLNLDKLNVQTDNLDLDNQRIVIDKVGLDNTFASIRLGKTAQEKAGETTEDIGDGEPEASPGWEIVVNNIALNNNHFVFDDDNSPKVEKGMDYVHLDASSLTLHARDFYFTTDSIAGAITKGELTEKSGLILNKLTTEFSYAGKGAYLKNLDIQTPGTAIKRDLVISYPSMEALQKDIGQLQMNIDLEESHVKVGDILLFAPFLASQPGFDNSENILLVNGSLKGKLNDLDIPLLQLSAFNNTRIDVRGRVKGLPDADKINGHLVINDFSTSKTDIVSLLPKGTLPTTITLPDVMNLKGEVTGSMNKMKTDLRLSTNLGSAVLNGNIANATNTKTATYNAVVEARQLQLGKILQNDSMFGLLSARISASGKGFDPKTMNAKLNGVVTEAVLNRYSYNDIEFSGELADQQGNIKLDIDDPNLRIALIADANISGEYPAIKLNANIDTINAYVLNFTTDTLTYAGKIEADFPNTNPADLTGNLFITRSNIVSGNQYYHLDTVSLQSGKTDTASFLQMDADGIHVALTGKYNLAQLGSVIQQTIQPYYALDSVANKDTLDQYDFNVVARVENSPLIKTFVSSLERMEPIQFNAHFEKGGIFNTHLDAPLILMGANRLQKLNLEAETKNDAININTSIEQFAAGESMIIYGTSLDAKIADNKINFLLNVEDQEEKNKYRLGGLFEQPEPGVNVFSLLPDELLLNYDKWNVPETNLIRLANNNIYVRDFIISRNGQKLGINSSSEESNSPLNVNFSDFRIETFTAFVKQDSLLAGGTINGDIVLRDVMQQPVFTSNLSISNLTVLGDTVGNLAIKVDNETANVFKANVELSGNNNEVDITGDYTIIPNEDGLANLVMDIKRLEMTSVEALSAGAIRRGSGYLSGNFDLKGTFSKPDIKGEINFNNVGFVPAMLGSYFTIDNKKIAVSNKGIYFDKFTIRDSANNDLQLDGWAYTDNFTNYKLDLNLTADNFQALNSTKQDNKLFYGQFYFDTDLRISGTEASPKVDGTLIVNNKTNLTIVMPQADPGVIEREGIVRFIDADSIKTNQVVDLAMDSLSKSDITGMDISVNIETNKDAHFTLVIDERNGDYLNISGTAQLTGGIDPSGKTTLAGNFDVENGAYQLSVNLLKRRFEIQKGSRITWLGEPTRADMNLTAVYVANTAPITLVEGQANVSNINIFKQKIPFNVGLILKGEMLKPDVSFDITLPNQDSVQLNVSGEVTDLVETRLAQLRTQTSEMNKQVFALLLLNRFVAENPFASSGGTSAETMARQSVSRILSDQLNNLAADLISGVDINFDLASSDDYTTGSRQNRTDLNVSVSKQLLNDRLRVTVGNNFEIEGPQSSATGGELIGNVALDYMLSKDGRYMIRGYRKNQFEGQLDGYIIETGLNFILTFDYEKFRDLFHSPKGKKLVKRANADKKKE